MAIQQDRWGVDQATALRALARNSVSRRATTIAVTSGKGGVGKTNVAVNLAIALAGRGLKVVLLDLDLGLANVDILMNIRSPKNLSHVIAGSHRLEQIMLEGPAGLKVIPGASGLERLANLSEFERHRLLLQFQELETDVDFVIMDLGAGVSKNVLAFTASADVALVVTTPEPTAVTDAYATIKLLIQGSRTTQVELLINQAQSGKEAQLTFDRLAGVAGRFLGYPMTFAGYVLMDDAVSLAVRSRSPLVLSAPNSAAAACIRALAHKYIRNADLPIKKESFFKRVAMIFQ